MVVQNFMQKFFKRKKEYVSLYSYDMFDLHTSVSHNFENCQIENKNGEIIAYYSRFADNVTVEY